MKRGDRVLCPRLGGGWSTGTVELLISSTMWVSVKLDDLGDEKFRSGPRYLEGYAHKFALLPKGWDEKGAKLTLVPPPINTLRTRSHGPKCKTCMDTGWRMNADCPDCS